VFQIFGKARQGGKAVAVTLAMAASVEQEHGITGLMQRRRQRQHHFGIPAPAVEDGNCGSRSGIPGRDEPGKQAFAVCGGNRDFSVGKPKLFRGAAFPDAGRAEADADEQGSGGHSCGQDQQCGCCEIHPYSAGSPYSDIM
jgi:hypothetical protein